MDFEKVKGSVLTDIKCRIVVKRGELKTVEPGVFERYSHKMFTDTDGIEEGDLITWGSLSLKVMRIYPVYNRDRFHHYEIYLEETDE